MSNEETRQTQWAMLWTILMNGSLALVVKFVGMPPEWWVLMLGVAFMHVVFLFCIVLLRGWMPKDKPDWDKFGAECQRDFRGE
jgi:hypothetical protein